MTVKTILQIGVNNGDDELFKYCKKNKNTIEKAIFVDASLEALLEAKERYKNVLPHSEFYNFAVTDTDNSEIEFFYPRDEPTSGHSSVFKDYVVAGHHNNIISKQIKTKRLNYFLDMFKDNCLDELHIDIEGLDAVVILDIDFNRYTIQKIRFEAAHCDGHFKKGITYTSAVNLLQYLNYDIQNDGLDKVCILNKDN